MAITVLNTFYGNGAGPSPQSFRVVYQLGYSDYDNVRGWYLQARMYVEVTNGQSGAWTSNLKPSWQDNRVALAGNGIYADTGWFNVGWIARGASHTFSCSAQYTGGSGTVYKSALTETYTAPAVTYLNVNYRNNYATDFGNGWPNEATGFNQLLQTLPYAIDQACNVHWYTAENASTYLGRDGYISAGAWNTKSDGSGISINEGTQFANGGDLAYTLGLDIKDGDKWVDLYPMWGQLTTYTVSYSANGGSGAPAAQVKTHNVDLTLSSKKPTREGYTFKGWSTNSSALSAMYTAGGAYANNETVTLYAVWEANQYKVTVNANGGYCSLINFNVRYNSESYNSIDEYLPTRKGYTFLGWYTSASGGEQVYDASGNCVDGAYWHDDKWIYLGTITIFARWKKNTNCAGNVNGVWKNGLLKMNVNGVWKVLSPNVNVNGTWKGEKRDKS